MSVLGIEQITYGVADLEECRRFLLDWGLCELPSSDDRYRYETLNGATVVLADSTDPHLPEAIEPGPTLREVTWGVAGQAELESLADQLRDQPGFYREPLAVGCLDPNGLAIRIEPSRRRPLNITGSPANVWGLPQRIDRASPVYARAEPIEIGHVVFFTRCLEEHVAFYRDRLGFVESDRYTGQRGTFLRAAPQGGHHDLFLLPLPDGRRGLNHVAFTVRDIHEVFGGGLHISRQGWTTQLGPGRHPISSAYFWYFRNPAGGLIEYYADEDILTGAWQAREVEPGPTVFAEWAIDGGLDGHTRRQVHATAPAARFMTDIEPD